jgi:hypothetical protein
MHFTAGIYYDDALRMNNYTLRLWMTTNSELSTDQNTAFERIKYFIYSQMDSTIFINKNLKEKCNQMALAGLNITTMPGDPVDQLIGIMLHYKLNAITEDRMIIVETEISSTMGENMTYLHGDFEDTSDYEQPDWWTSADLTHSDIMLEGSEKIVAMTPGIGWREVEMSWVDTPTLSSDATGNIVVFNKFKRPNETE